MDMKAKSYNGQTYYEGTANLFQGSGDTMKTTVEFGGKRYFVTVVPRRGTTRSGKDTVGFIAFREAPNLPGGGRKKV